VLRAQRADTGLCLPGKVGSYTDMSDLATIASRGKATVEMIDALLRDVRSPVTDGTREAAEVNLRNLCGQIESWHERQAQRADGVRA
jgi:hypothetical protein